MSDENRRDEYPLQRFEDLAKRLFSIAKDDVMEVEEAAKALAEDVLGPPPTQALDAEQPEAE